MYQIIITEAADVNGIICSFTRKLQFLFINKVRTRDIINLNILNWIKLIEKCSVVAVIVFVCDRNDDSSAHKIVYFPRSGAISAHTACVPRPSPTEPCSGPPLLTGPGTAIRTASGHGSKCLVGLIYQSNIETSADPYDRVHV